MTAQTQPESHYLADQLDACADDPMWADHAEISKTLCISVAACLRHLHSENQRIKHLADEAMAEVKRLEVESRIREAELRLQDAKIAQLRSRPALSDERIDALRAARNLAMRHMAAARIPECGEFGKIAQGLDAVLNTIGEPT